MEFEFVIGQKKEKIEVEPGQGVLKIAGPDGDMKVDVRRISNHGLSLLAEGRSHRVFFARDKERLHLWLDGESFEMSEPSEEAGGRRTDDGAGQGLWRIVSPMPGKVIKVVVAEGDKVRKNQTLAVVEAMKMENELKAPGDGTVKKIYAAAGETVDTSNPLLEIESGSF